MIAGKAVSLGLVVGGIFVFVVGSSVPGNDILREQARQGWPSSLSGRGEPRLAISTTAKKKLKKKLKKSGKYQRLSTSDKRKLGGVKRRKHDGKIRTPGKATKK